ncbi:MAG: lactonase family protein [Kiritimatiellia bacterium]
MNHELQLLIGSYTHGNKTGAGEGITLARFDLQTGELRSESVFREMVNPSYLTAEGGFVYAVSEQFDRPGQVVCLERNGSELRERWRASSGGLATCHLTLDNRRGVIHAASYMDGKLISLNARTGERLFYTAYEGQGPDIERQKRAHAHQACVTPDGAFLLVPDLGSDKVWRHPLSPEGIPGEVPDACVLPPGTGPRHLVFHPDLPLACVLGELDGRVHVIDWQTARCVCSPVSMAPTGWPGPHGASAIRLHPRLPYLYAAHRASRQLSRLRIGPDGAVAPADLFDAGGREPRDFVLTSDGNWLLVACQHSDCVAVHRLDAEGRLSLIHQVNIPAACRIQEIL